MLQSHVAPRGGRERLGREALEVVVEHADALPRGWGRTLVRQLLAGSPEDAAKLDASQLERLSQHIAQRREFSDPPEGLDLLDQRIREILAER